jgi:hypothetical protein
MVLNIFSSIPILRVQSVWAGQSGDGTQVAARFFVLAQTGRIMKIKKVNYFRHLVVILGRRLGPHQRPCLHWIKNNIQNTNMYPCSERNPKPYFQCSSYLRRHKPLRSSATNRTGDVRINVTLRCIRVTTVAMEKRGNCTEEDPRQ